MFRTRAQSVLDVVEEDRLLMFRGLAEGDDADFAACLRVHNGNDDALQHAKRNKALLRVGKTIVFVRKGRSSKDRWSVDEVQPVLLQIQPRFVPSREDSIRGMYIHVRRVSMTQARAA